MVFGGFSHSWWNSSLIYDQPFTQRASLVAQMVKSLPAMPETWIWSLAWEDPLEKEMAALSSTLAWKIPWTDCSLGCSPWGRQELDTTEQLHFTSFTQMEPNAISLNLYKCVLTKILSKLI